MDVMRHPSFEGMRVDKKASDVKEEKAAEYTKKLQKQTHCMNRKFFASGKQVTEKHS